MQQVILILMRIMPLKSKKKPLSTLYGLALAFITGFGLITRKTTIIGKEKIGIETKIGKTETTKGEITIKEDIKGTTMKADLKVEAGLMEVDMVAVDVGKKTTSS